MTDDERSVRGWNRRNEDQAAALMCHYLGGRPRRVDPGGGAHQLHDFEVDLHDGQTMAVEVTQHVNAAETRTLSEIQKRHWFSAALGCSWSIGHLGNLNVANLHRELPGLLQSLEASDRRSWIATERSQPPDDPVLATLHRLGVRSVQARDPEPRAGAGVIVLSRSSIGHWFDASDVLDAIAMEANEAGNARKLEQATGADLRVLFIWAGDFAGIVEAAMTWGELPTSPPDVPVAIDAVWIATAAEPAKVWRYSMAAGWEKLEPYTAGG
jgi:hypothetical protein